ncbi:MAG: MutS2/Smr-associated SH3 domain-containing protein, partial [Ginsengibacter sp.]
RIGLHHSLINRARQLVDEGHFRLDKLLNRTEQEMKKIEEDKRNLLQLLKENERLKKEMETQITRERHRQRIELLKHGNKVSIEKLSELKDLERKLKMLVIEWRKTENKNEVIKMINDLLFRQKERFIVAKHQKKIDEKFEETGKDISTGDKVKMKNSRQVGTVKEIRGKKAIIQVGVMPITVKLADLVAVKEKVS